MKRIGILILLAVLALTLINGCSSFNSMVSGREKVNTQWANVEAQYQKRSDLIPNLVATVKGVADFEQKTLTDIVEARSKATQVKIDPSNMTEEDMKRFQEAQGTLSNALGRLLMITENYPQLRATESFKELQSQLEGIENRIAVERQKFNEVCREYNTGIQSFPKNIYAGIFGFKPRPYFTAAAGADKAPEVKF